MLWSVNQDNIYQYIQSYFVSTHEEIKILFWSTQIQENRWLAIRLLYIDRGLLYGWTAQPDSACSPQAQHAACTTQYYTMLAWCTVAIISTTQHTPSNSALTACLIFAIITNTAAQNYSYISIYSLLNLFQFDETELLIHTQSH